MTEPNCVQHSNPETRETVEPTDDLRWAIRKAILDARSADSALDENDEFDEADAAIAAYRAHPDGGVKDMTPEGCQCGHDDQCAFAARAEKAESERDAALAQAKASEELYLYASRALATTRREDWIAGRDAAAAECDRHAAFLHKEAHAGGDFSYLMAAYKETIYNATRIRTLTPPEPAP